LNSRTYPNHWIRGHTQIIEFEDIPNSLNSRTYQNLWIRGHTQLIEFEDIPKSFNSRTYPNHWIRGHTQLIEFEDIPKSLNSRIYPTHWIRGHSKIIEFEDIPNSLNSNVYVIFTPCEYCCIIKYKMNDKAVRKFKYILLRGLRIYFNLQRLIVKNTKDYHHLTCIWIEYVRHKLNLERIDNRVFFCNLVLWKIIKTR